MMVPPSASAPLALVVMPTVQFALTALTDEDGLKETPEMTEPKLSPLAELAATVSALVETLNELLA